MKKKISRKKVALGVNLYPNPAAEIRESIWRDLFLFFASM